nr:F42 [uncultured bacterium]
MGRDRENTRKLHARAQRAYLARQRELRAPTTAELYRALALAVRDRSRARFVKSDAPEAKGAILAILETAYADLATRGYAEVQIRKCLSRLLRSAPSREGDAAAPAVVGLQGRIDRALHVALNRAHNAAHS